jgi:transposase
MFADEFGLSFRDRLATTWGAVGQTPVLRREDKRRGMSCFCGLTTTGKVYTVYFKGSIDGECIVQALLHIRRYLKGPVTLIWDRLSAHRSPAVKKYLGRDRRLVVEQLPAYSPDLNPEEFCHGYVKERMRNSTPTNENELLHLAELEFNRLRRRPRILRNFFAHAGLPLFTQSG